MTNPESETDQRRGAKSPHEILEQMSATGNTRTLRLQSELNIKLHEEQIASQQQLSARADWLSKVGLGVGLSGLFIGSVQIALAICN